MPIITQVPQAEETFRKTYTADKIETMKMAHTGVNTAKLHCCYTLTEIDFQFPSFRADYAFASTGSGLSELGRQAQIMMLANELFKDSKPLAGREMEILDKTFKRLRSTVPTKL